VKTQPRRDFNLHPPRPLDRITFSTADEGVQGGYVSMLSRHIGNGQRFAWVEMDAALPGAFRAVLLTDVLTCDDAGISPGGVATMPTARRRYLGDFSNQIDDAWQAGGE